jgi:hypothetical protein
MILTSLFHQRSNQAQGIRFSLEAGPALLPMVLGTSYTTATMTTAKTLVLAGVTGLSGSEEMVVAVVAAEVGTNINVSLEGAAAATAVRTTSTTSIVQACAECNHWSSVGSCGCVTFTLQFGGDWVTEMMPVTEDDVPASFAGGWFNSTFTVSPTMWAVREQRQQEFDIAWNETADMDAAWLGNRLLVYPYILQPSNETIPQLWVNQKRVPMTPAYNSRGHIVQKCFMGHYWNATEFVGANANTGGVQQLALYYPPLNVSGGQHLLGVYWYGTADSYSTDATVV